MARILISGATGFLGRHLVTALAGTHRVYALTRSEGFGDSPGVTWVRHDLCEPRNALNLPSQIDAVIHLAQSRHYRSFPDRADDIFNVNVNGTFRLIDYARNAGAQRFILASSGGVYGSSFERLTEAAPISPLNFYLSSKYAAELLVGCYSPWLRTIVFRFFFVYGPGQARMLIPSLMQKIRDGQTVTVEGNPGIRINPVFVDDAVKIFEPALRAERSEVLNVAGAETVTFTELVQKCAAAVGREPRIEYAPASQVGDLVGATDRLRETLRVECNTPLDEGLRATAAEFLKQGSTPARRERSAA